MLHQLLNTPTNPTQQLYQFLPISTSLQQQLHKQATELLSTVTLKTEPKKVAPKFHEFIPNEDTENIKNDLILAKLGGFIDRRNISGINTEMKKLPTKVQVGRMIEGDPFLAHKRRISQNKKEMTLTDYYLDLDKKEGFSDRKFSQIQRMKQRRKKISKKSLKKLDKKANKSK